MAETSERITESQATAIAHYAEELQKVITGERRTGWGNDAGVEANLRDIAESLIQISQARYPDTFREWMQQALPEYIEDIYTHGAGQGYPHLTYTYDMEPIYDRYEQEIWEAIYEDSQSIGDGGSLLAFIGSWQSASTVTDAATFKALCVWYMAERVARQIMEEDE